MIIVHNKGYCMQISMCVDIDVFDITQFLIKCTKVFTIAENVKVMYLLLFVLSCHMQTIALLDIKLYNCHRGCKNLGAKLSK